MVTPRSGQCSRIEQRELHVREFLADVIEVSDLR